MSRKAMAATVILLAATLLTGLSLTIGAEPEGHPDVGKSGECVACHEAVTPEVTKEWFAGPHGLNNVKCFVCHGSTGTNFTKVPDTTRCVGCHADQVVSMSEPMMKGKTCFSCHPNHLLKPHGAGM